MKVKGCTSVAAGVCSKLIVVDRILRAGAEKAAGRQLLSTLDPEKNQALACVFPKGCAVKTTDMIDLLESELEEIKPRGVVRI